MDLSLREGHRSNQYPRATAKWTFSVMGYWGNSAVLYPTSYLLAKSNILHLEISYSLWIPPLVFGFPCFCILPKLEFPFFLAHLYDHLHWETCLASTDVSTWHGLTLSFAFAKTHWVQASWEAHSPLPLILNYHLSRTRMLTLQRHDRLFLEVKAAWPSAWESVSLISSWQFWVFTASFSCPCPHISIYFCGLEIPGHFPCPTTGRGDLG